MDIKGLEKRMEKFIKKAVKTRLSYFLIIDHVVATEVGMMKAGVKKGEYSSMELYHTLLVELGRRVGVIESEEESAFLMAYLVNEAIRIHQSQ